jgi:hypothetical protein
MQINAEQWCKLVTDVLALPSILFYSRSPDLLFAKKSKFCSQIRLNIYVFTTAI